MIESKITSNGASTVEYLVQGQGPALVILPSLGRGAGDYDEIADLLEERGIRTVRPQPRGIGRSAGPMTGLTMVDLAQDVAAVIEAEGLAPALVAGHAFGNFVARTLATVRPDLVTAISMVAGSAAKTLTGEFPYAPDVAESVLASGDPKLSEQERLVHLQRAFFAPGNDASVWLTGWYPATKAAQKIAQKATPLDFYFAGGTAPIFEIQARNDTVANFKYASTMKTLFGERITVAVVDNAGHALIPEQPVETARLLGDWVFNWPPDSRRAVQAV